jgi:hypothetical protein
MPPTDDFIKTRFRVFDVPLDTKGENFFSEEIATALGEVEKFLKPRLKI